MCETGFPFSHIKPHVSQQSQKGSHMKKIVFLTMSVVLLSINYCGDKTVPVKKTNIKSRDSKLLISNQKDQSTRWVNDHTLIVKTTGEPNPGARGFIKRRAQAKRTAILIAQKEAIKLLGKKVKEGILISSDLEMIVKNGRIISENYDQKNNCSILYKITVQKK